MQRLARATWGSLLRRTVIVFLVAYAATGPAIYLVYWDQVRANGTTLALGHASAARGGVARLMLDVAGERSAVDRHLATADTTAAPDYAAAQQEAATDLHAIAGDVAGTDLEARLAPVVRTISAWQDWARAAMAPVDAAGPPAADPARVQQGRDLYDAFHQRGQELDQAAADRATALRSAADSQQRAAIRDNVLTPIVVIVIVSIVVAFLLGTTIRSMGRLATTARQLSDGVRVAVPYADRNDEVGELARALSNWRIAESARRAAVEEREILLEQAPVGICRLDVDGRLLSGNRTLLAMLGATAAEALGRPLGEFFHSDDRAREREAHRSLAEGNAERLAGEGRVLHRDGRVVWCASVTTPLLGLDGALVGFIVILEDISDRRRQADRAAQIQRQLLPRGSPDIAGYELAGACLPAEDVAGDFYDWVVSDDGQIDVTVADVMGKGVGAALVMAVLRTALRSAPADLGPAAQVGLAAGSMALGVDDDGLFVTLFHAHLDSATGVLNYVDAGHGYCAVRRSSGDLTPLPVRSLPVGAPGDEPFLEGTVTLGPHDTLVVYSDGLVETAERTLALHEFTTELDGADSAGDMVRRLMARMPSRPDDDVTVLVLHRLDEDGAQEHAGVPRGPAVELELAWSAAPADQLDLIHDAMARFWQGLRPPPSSAWRMLFELAIAEVAANVIEHARPALMSMRLGIDAGSVVAEIAYAGPGWTDSLATALPDPMAERGRGLFLARTGVDEVSYQRAGMMVTWRLVKHL